MVPASTAQHPKQGAPGGPQQLPPDSRSRPLQQALLSLSQLHIDHGHVDAATTALLEAVDVDQGSGDTHAMVMCLMQLCVIMHATTPDCTGEAKSPAALMQVTQQRFCYLSSVPMQGI
jgi:Anaphase-promoting complex subunit 5